MFSLLTALLGHAGVRCERRSSPYEKAPRDAHIVAPIAILQWNGKRIDHSARRELDLGELYLTDRGHLTGLRQGSEDGVKCERCHDLRRQESTEIIGLSGHS